MVMEAPVRRVRFSCPIREKSATSGGSFSGQRVLVADEAAVLGDLVVERPRGGVVGLGEPVHARAARLPRAHADGLDQRPAGAVAAVGVVREQILQVADGGPRLGAGAAEDMG